MRIPRLPHRSRDGNQTTEKLTTDEHAQTDGRIDGWLDYWIVESETNCTSRRLSTDPFYPCPSVSIRGWIMILLLGASGYIGQAFARELQSRKLPFMPLSRKEADYTRFDALWNHLKTKKPEFVINAAGYTGKPNVDACELARADALAGNALLPQTIAHACAAAQIPWGHVSSGCIFTGAKVMVNGRTRAEKDLMQPALHELVDKTPTAIHGYTETDAPNFSFRDLPCSFYSGTKALGEEAIAGIGQSYIWRLRIPFDEFDSARNYLSKMQRYPKVYDNVNSISHRADFVKVCLDLWERRAPFGIYNVTNP